VSTLSSASTIAEVQAAYDDNASYEEDASTAKCRAFVTACRFLLRRIPKRAVHGGRGGGEEIETDPTQIAAELAKAQRWLAAHAGPSAGGAGAIYGDFRDMRQ